MTGEPSFSDPAIIAGGVMLGQMEASKRGALTIWTIFDKPKDFPEGYIARRFEVSEGGRTLATRDTLTGKLEDIRMALEKAGLMKMAREDGDEPQIVENWV